MLKISDKSNAGKWCSRLYQLAARHGVCYRELKDWIWNRYEVSSSGELYLSQYYELKEILKVLPLKRIKNESQEEWQLRKLRESGLSLTNRSVPVSVQTLQTRRRK